MGFNLWSDPEWSSMLQKGRQSKKIPIRILSSIGGGDEIFPLQNPKLSPLENPLLAFFFGESIVFVAPPSFWVNSKVVSSFRECFILIIRNTQEKIRVVNIPSSEVVWGILSKHLINRKQKETSRKKNHTQPANATVTGFATLDFGGLWISHS